MIYHNWWALGLGLVLASLPAKATNSAPILDPKDCALIHDFEDTTSRSFAEHFSKMATQREYCPEVKGVCQVPLQKRVEDYYLLIEGQKNSFQTVEVATAAKEAIELVLTQFQDTSSLRMRLEKPQGTTDYVYFLFVKQDLVDFAFDLYTKAHIIHGNFNLSVREKTQQVKLFNIWGCPR